MPLGTPQQVSITHPTLGTLLVHATTNEKHGIHVKVTDFPVEQGADVSDNKRRQPDPLVITGIITNTPLDANGTQQVSETNPQTGDLFIFNVAAQNLSDSLNSSKAYDFFNNAAADANLLTISTEVRVYQNMVLTDLDIPRDAKSGDSFQFTATFQSIIIVNNQIALVKQTRTPSGQAKQSKGGQATQQTPAQQRVSMIQTLRKTGANLAKQLSNLASGAQVPGG